MLGQNSSPQRRKRFPGAPADSDGNAPAEAGQSLEALEAYVSQAEQALSDALSEAARNDRRIEALEAELKATQRQQPIPIRAPRSGQRAFDALERHAQAAREALAEALNTGESKAERLKTVEAELETVRGERQQQHDELRRQLGEAQKEISQRDRQINALEARLKDFLDSHQSRLQEQELALNAARTENQRLAGIEQRATTSEKRLAEREHQLHKLQEVVEYYVLRCRELEDRPSPSATEAANHPEPEERIVPHAQPMDSEPCQSEECLHFAADAHNENAQPDSEFPTSILT